jgi:hypothetical protein
VSSSTDIRDLNHFHEASDPSDADDEFPVAVPETVSAELHSTEADTTESAAGATAINVMGQVFLPKKSSQQSTHSPYSTTIKSKENAIVVAELTRPTLTSSPAYFFEHVIKRIPFNISKTRLCEDTGLESSPAAAQGEKEAAEEHVMQSATIHREEAHEGSVPTVRAVEKEPLKEAITVKAVRVSSSKEERHLLFKALTYPVLLNYQTITKSMRSLVEMDEEVLGEPCTPSSIPPSSTCVLLLRKNLILDELEAAHCDSDVEDVLRHYLDLSNSQLSMRWNIFLSACKRKMPHLRDQMKAHYQRSIRFFWRRQLLVHTKW